MNEEPDQYDADMEDFLQQVDADKELRTQMNLYKATPSTTKASSKRAKTEAAAAAARKMEVEEEEDVDYDEEEVRLEELLDDLTLAADLIQEEEEGKDIMLVNEPADTVFDMGAFSGLQNDDDEDDEL